jgi:hypothetical protein
MKAKAEEHLPGGKLIRIYIEHGDFINHVKLSGDFSLHPEEAINELEKCLVDVEIESSQEGIANLIEDTLSTHHAKLEGVTPSDIARIVKKAVNR